MPADTIPEIVEGWMATEEFELTGWDDVIATEFLTDMKKLLSRTDARECELWMAFSV